MNWHKKLCKKLKNGNLRFFDILEKDKELEMYAYEHTLRKFPDLEALVLLKHNLIYPYEGYIKEGENLKHFIKMFDDKYDKNLLNKLKGVLEID